MKRLTALVFLSIITVNVALAQMRSDARTLELTGTVKVVRSFSISFDLIDGKYVESGTGSGLLTQVFDREGMKIFEEVRSSGPICGVVAPDYSKLKFDHDGSVIEFLPNDTVEHSGYKLKHTYDSNGRRIETEYYDPYILRDKWTYKYEAFDELGNWTGRTVTREKAVNGKFARTLQMRSIQYY